MPSKPKDASAIASLTQAQRNSPTPLRLELARMSRVIAFVAVAVCVLVLRRRDPDGRRPFRTPAAWLVAPGAILGCLYLFTSLQSITQLSFFVWNAGGLLIYFLYARRRSLVA